MSVNILGFFLDVTPYKILPLCVVTSAAEIIPHIFCIVMFRSQSTKLKSAVLVHQCFTHFLLLVRNLLTVEENLRVFKRPSLGKEQGLLPFRRPP